VHDYFKFCFVRTNEYIKNIFLLIVLFDICLMTEIHIENLSAHVIIKKVSLCKPSQAV